jgi:UDP-2,4-diacetamido-2,4,6-trideoxy-beta-L-altropyranose hydrolase
MHAVLRADASLTIGSGHVMRCLTLASALRARGAAVQFVCREYPGHLCDLIEGHGFAVTRLAASNSGTRVEDPPTDAAWCGASWQEDAERTRAAIDALGVRPDWLVVDHYALDHRWQTALRRSVDRIMVIDDLADRSHDCDLLLDQNYYVDGDTRYDLLVPPRSVTLLGPSYALLREEFLQARRSLRKRDGTVHRVLVSFGGGTANAEIIKTLQAIETLATPLNVDVILGASNRDQIPPGCYSTSGRATFHPFVSNMAEMIEKADLFVGAAGSTTWERCCLGIPSIIMSLARNQDAIAVGCANAGACLYLGRSEEVSSRMIGRVLQEATSNKKMLADMSVRASLLTDSLGTERVLRVIDAQSSSQLQSSN